MKSNKLRKGALAATLLLCILIITMATYIMIWIYDRYLSVIRFHRSSSAKIRTQGISYKWDSCCRCAVIGGCSPSTPPECTNFSLDSTTIIVPSITNCSATTSQAMTFSTDEEIH